MSLPLLVRPNSVIAVGSHEERPDYDYADGLTLQLYQLEEGQTVSAVIPSLTGPSDLTFEIRQADHTITVEWQGTAKRWQLLLGIESITSAAGGIVENSPKGVLVTPAPEADRLTISRDGS